MLRPTLDIDEGCETEQRSIIRDAFSAIAVRLRHCRTFRKPYPASPHPVSVKLEFSWVWLRIYKAFGKPYINNPKIFMQKARNIQTLRALVSKPNSILAKPAFAQLCSLCKLSATYTPKAQVLLRVATVYGPNAGRILESLKLPKGSLVSAPKAPVDGSTCLGFLGFGVLGFLGFAELRKF